MAIVTKVEAHSILMGKFCRGADILEELTAVCRVNKINLGKVTAIGALQKACLGFYNQQTHTYRYHDFDSPMELVQLSGNVSLKDGSPFVHAHVTLADEEGKTVGGHCVSGVIFAGEFEIEVFNGTPLERSFDLETGLQLWGMEGRGDF